MDIFLDTGDENEARRWVAKGVLAGGTSNPILLRNAYGNGQPHQDTIVSLSKIYHPAPLSVEVTTAESTQAMVAQALTIHGWNDNIVVKVPVVGPDGEDLLDVIHTLAQQGVRVNATACITPAQAWMAAKAGAAYASLMWGRVLDEGGDPFRAVALFRQWTADAGLTDTKLILGSIRSVGDAIEAMNSGADLVTIPPAVLAAFVRHGMATRTSQQLFAAAQP